MFRFIGAETVFDEAPKKSVFKRIVQKPDEYAANVERSVEQLPRRTFAYDNAFIELGLACQRVLRAEAVLGNAAHAIELCTKARGRLETWLQSFVPIRQ